jgi:hypothetical protein
LPRIAAWKSLLEENIDFSRWYENLKRGSINTANLYARTIIRLSKELETNPSQIIIHAKENQRGFEDTILDFVTKLEKEGKAPSYIDSYLKILKSWLGHNEITLKRKIKVGNLHLTPTIEDERIPVKDELKQILGYAKARGRCSIALMAFSGLRPESLAYSHGLDGLEIRDLPELEIEGSQVSFSVIPTMVVVRPEISKAKHKYFSFLGPEGCEYLKSYLEKRLAEGENLDPKTALISVKKGYNDTGYRVSGRDNQHITTKTLTKEIRDAMRPKYDWRPYVLRSYFDTQLLVAENNGKIAHAYRQFFMGHKGDMEARYTTNKGRLPDNLIEDMRSAYRKSVEYLETRKTEIGEDKLKEALRRQLLLVAGFSGDEIDDLDGNMTDVEFQDAVRKKLLGATVNNGNPQKVINQKEIANYLDQGWSLID